MVAYNLLNDQELMVLSDELRERICDAVRQRYEIEWATDVQSFHWLRRYAGLDEPSVQKARERRMEVKREIWAFERQLAQDAL